MISGLGFKAHYTVDSSDVSKERKNEFNTAIRDNLLDKLPNVVKKDFFLDKKRNLHVTVDGNPDKKFIISTTTTINKFCGEDKNKALKINEKIFKNNFGFVPAGVFESDKDN